MSLQILEEEMALRGFTKATKEAYRWNIKRYLESDCSKRAYLLYLLTKDLSSSSVHP